MVTGSIVKKQSTATAAFNAIQRNFQGSMRFQQVNLLERLVDLKTAPLPTDLHSLQILFNKIFKLFSDLGKVNATIPPLVESLFLQILVPPPPNMSCSQLFQNISLQLSGKKEVTARDVQVIINSAYTVNEPNLIPNIQLLFPFSKHSIINPSNPTTNAIHPAPLCSPLVQIQLLVLWVN